MNQLLKNYKEVLDQHAIVAVTDTMGAITYVNDKFCEISKYSRDDLIGKNHRILNSGTHAKEFFRDLWSSIVRGMTWNGDICNKTKNGDLYWVKTTILPFKDGDGNISQFVAVRTDITEKILLARELEKVNEILERQADQLNAERLALGNKNIALREVIDHVEDGKRKLEESIRNNFENIVTPILNRMEEKFQGLDSSYFLLLKNSLEDIAQPFLKGQPYAASLSPKEIAVCNMIKNGLTAKEMAAILNLSPRTVDKHRENIRKKLQITSRAVNLTSYLMSGG